MATPGTAWYDCHKLTRAFSCTRNGYSRHSMIRLSQVDKGFLLYQKWLLQAQHDTTVTSWQGLSPVPEMATPGTAWYDCHKLTRAFSCTRNGYSRHSMIRLSQVDKGFLLYQKWLLQAQHDTTVTSWQGLSPVPEMATPGTAWYDCHKLTRAFSCTRNGYSRHSMIRLSQVDKGFLLYQKWLLQAQHDTTVTSWQGLSPVPEMATPGTAWYDCHKLTRAFSCIRNGYSRHGMIRLSQVDKGFLLYQKWLLQAQHDTTVTSWQGLSPVPEMATPGTAWYDCHKLTKAFSCTRNGYSRHSMIRLSQVDKGFLLYQKWLLQAQHDTTVTSWQGLSPVPEMATPGTTWYDCHKLTRAFSCTSLTEIHWVSEWLLFNVNSAIFQLYHGENKLIFNEMMMRSTLI